MTKTNPIAVIPAQKYNNFSNVRVSRNIPRKEFVNLLRNIDLLVGNSSMALLEGSFLKIPAINVGERNSNRMNGGNVIFVDAEVAKIQEVIQGVVFCNESSNTLKDCKQVYGDGKSAKKIVDFMKRLNRTRIELTAKNITY